MHGQHALEKDRLESEIDELRRQLATAEEQLARMPALGSQLADLVKLNDELLQVNSELVQKQVILDELAEIAERYTVVVNSTSWRVTRPLRYLTARARKAFR
ncbi:MAG: hypothetical protein JWL67_1562 [Solirubrobacterales bacterium]|nr:hypothetical protein [Solirubrobacterales bacterium]